MKQTTYYTVWVRRNNSKEFEKICGRHSKGFQCHYDSIAEAKADLDEAINDWDGQAKHTSREKRSLEFAQQMMIMEWKINRHVLTTESQDKGVLDRKPLPKNKIPKAKTGDDYFNI